MWMYLYPWSKSSVSICSLEELSYVYAIILNVLQDSVNRQKT